MNRLGLKLDLLLIELLILVKRANFSLEKQLG